MEDSEILLGVVDDGRAEPAPRQEVSGGRLLLADARTVLLLLNHARHRAIDRLFGVPEADQNIVTLIAVLLLAQAIHDQMHKLARAATGPSAPDTLLGLVWFRELLAGAAGPAARETPGGSTLLMIAVLGGATGPVVIRQARAMKAGAHRLNAGFHDRYGYLIDPGHWRQRRAQFTNEARRTADSAQGWQSR